MATKKPEARTSRSDKKPDAIVPRPAQIRDLINATLPLFDQVLPKAAGLTAERFVRIAINCIEADQTGKLARCSNASLTRAMLQAAEVGLEPGGAYGYCYLIPYFNKERGMQEAQFQIGAWGLVNLAQRSGEVLKVWADVIYEKDEHLVRSGTAGRVIEHKPAWQFEGPERGARLGAYACMLLKNGEVLSELVNEKQIQRARAMNKGKSPAWDNWGDEMAKKVALKRQSKYGPKVTEYRRAIEIDDNPESLPADIARKLADVRVIDTEGSASKSTLDRVMEAKGAPQAPTPSPAEPEPACCEEFSRGKGAHDPTCPTQEPPADPSYLDDDEPRQPGEEG